MDRTERFYLIDRLLHERRIVSRVQFLKALGVSLATFKRDLEYMRDRLHAPIVWNAEKSGYEFGQPDGISPAYELPGLWFNDSEIYALLTMQQLLSDMEPGLLSAHVAPLKARLELLLGEGDVEARDVHKRVRILQQSARRLPPGVFETMANGVLRRRRVRIAYQARSTGEASERVISPQRLVRYRDNWYVDAWCHLRDGLRKFSIDAIASAELMAERARAVDMKMVEKTFSSGYGVFAGEIVEWATLHFTPLRARWVAQEQWHSEQRGHSEADGSYVLEVPFVDPRELMMDILKFGADVEVIGPPTLRKLVASEVARMVVQRRQKDAKP